MTGFASGRVGLWFATALTAGLATLPASQSALAHPHVFVTNRTQAVFDNGALTGLRYRWVFDEMYTTSAVEGLDKNNDGNLDAAELDELLKVNIEGLKEFDYFTSAMMAGKPVPFADAKDFGMKVIEVDEAPGPQLMAGGPVVTGPVAGPAAGSGQASAPLQSAPSEAPRTVWGRLSAWVSGLFGRSTPAPTIAGGAQTNTTHPASKPKVLTLTFTLPFKTPLAAENLVPGQDGFQFQVGDPQNFIWFEPAGPNAIGIAPGAPAGCRHVLVEPHMTEDQKRLAEAFAKVGGAGAGGLAKANGVVCAKP